MVYTLLVLDCSLHNTGFTSSVHKTVYIRNNPCARWRVASEKILTSIFSSGGKVMEISIFPILLKRFLFLIWNLGMILFPSYFLKLHAPSSSGVVVSVSE